MRPLTEPLGCCFCFSTSRCVCEAPLCGSGTSALSQTPQAELGILGESPLLSSQPGSVFGGSQPLSLTGIYWFLTLGK